jgi:hypothetical protein
MQRLNGRRTPPDNKHAIRDPLGPGPKDLKIWRSTITARRVSELFKTAQGVPGHAQQIQNEVNRLSNVITVAPGKADEAKESLRQIKQAIEKAKIAAEADGYSAPHSTLIQFPLINDNIQV